MNILLLGSGGREHALAWKIAQSRRLKKLYIAPGNAGTANTGTNIDVSPNNFEDIKKFVLQNSVHLLVVGPEEPLVNGIYDFFMTDNLLKNIPVIGPSRQGAMLEGSKDFAKKFMETHSIPTAKYKSFSSETLRDGYDFLKSLYPPYVLKADGLAAGKGVIILNNLAEAQNALKEMLHGKFGSASRKVVIEEFLKGVEVSVFVLTDGYAYKILPEAKDYKRIGDNDTGLNTGGMGAVSPVPFADKPFMQKVEDRIIKPTIVGLQKEQIAYKGFIFIGLMNVESDPYVIEYNVRMGDPETEAVIPRIKTDIMDLFDAVAKKRLADISIDIDDRTVATVMLVSGGYPEAYEKGKLITHLEDVKNSMVFHAGTQHINGKILTNGGRVLCVSSYGNSIKEARELSYQNASVIHYEGKYYRSDIGMDLIK
ncbi:MAG: phosphoribosylamine--glycine ligase [Bacteroidia bacterium]|nr:phosphoribosylamine--glycine ligase [Bacteroidia bacterium]